MSHVPELATCLEKVTLAENFRFAVWQADRQFVFLPGRLHSYKQWDRGRMGTQLNNHADQRKARHDRHARELPLAAGERVYLREHIECPTVVDRERPGRPRGNIFVLAVSDCSSTSGDEEEDVRPVT